MDEETIDKRLASIIHRLIYGCIDNQQGMSSYLRDVANEIRGIIVELEKLEDNTRLNAEAWEIT